MTELGIAERALPATISRNVLRGPCLPRVSPGSMSFLPEGILVAKAPRGSLSGPLEATKIWEVTCAASPV